MAGKVTVVLDAQAGSCGKGKFIGYLAKKDKPSMAICNFMSNAGHTFIDDDGDTVITQQIPTSIVNKSTSLYIGPEAAITPSILFNEILKYKKAIGDRAVIIHPNAAVITDVHRAREQRILRSGSTFKGCGAARADKVMRQAMLFGEFWNKMQSNYDWGDENEFSYLCTTDEWNELVKMIAVQDMTHYVNTLIDTNSDIIIEGSQGCDLDINFGLPYPHTTSRQCHACQLTADCGISPRLVTDIIMIMRPYPIRISNTTNLKNNNGDSLVVSSGDYDNSEEITWEEVKRRCGAPDDISLEEKTTVTKKTRRVFEMNWERLKYVTKLNRPTGIALNFVQYIDWNALGCTRYHELPGKVRRFIDRVEMETGVPVVLIGTGARNNEIIDRRS